MVCGSGLRRGHADALVVVHLLNGDLGPLLGDVVIAALAASLGHTDHGLLPQGVRRPGYAPAVVAVGGAEERGLAELLPQRGAGQIVVGHLRDVPVHRLGDIARHRKGAAQHLERVQAEAVGLILHIQSAQPEILGHPLQACQRGRGILGEAAVEEAGLGNVREGHNAQIAVVAGGHSVRCPFDGSIHRNTS